MGKILGVFFRDAQDFGRWLARRLHRLKASIAMDFDIITFLISA